MEQTGPAIAVTGAKGGIGKTTTSINVSATFAAAGVETVLVEFDLAMANVVDFLHFGGRGEPDPTLHDVLAGDVPVTQACYTVAENFDVVPSGTSLEGYAKTDLETAPDVVEELQREYDAVVLDTGAGLSQATVTPVRLADGVVVVSTPRVASIRDADKTKSLADRVDTDVLGLVLTKSGTGNAPEAGRIAEFLDTHLLGHVPHDEAVPASQDQGQPVVQSAPDSDAGRTYRKVGRKLCVGFGFTDRDDAPRAETRTQSAGRTKAVGDGGKQTLLSQSGTGDGNESGHETESERTDQEANPDEGESDVTSQERKSDGKERSSTDQGTAPTRDVTAETERERSAEAGEDTLADDSEAREHQSGRDPTTDTGSPADDEADEAGPDGGTSLLSRVRSVFR